jgi:hypothetical protein
MQLMTTASRQILTRGGRSELASPRRGRAGGRRYQGPHALGLHGFPAKSMVVRLKLARSHLCPECGCRLEQDAWQPHRNHGPCSRCELDSGPLIAAG